MNPYKTLDVPRDATKAEIKRAYRDRVKDVHPDKGGTKEAFHEVHTALAILTNEKRRRHYDATGETADTPVDNAIAAVHHKIAMAVNSVFEGCANGNVDVETIDWVGFIGQALQLGLDQVNKNLTAAEKEKRRTEKLQKRKFKRKSKTEPNVLEGLVAGRLHGIVDSIRMMNLEAEAFRAALAIVQDHTFEAASSFVTGHTMRHAASSSATTSW